MEREREAAAVREEQDLGARSGLGLVGGGGGALVAQLVKIHLQCRRPGFDPWVGKIPWRRERLPTPVFCLGEFHGLYSPWGCKESDMTEQLSLPLHFTV